MDEAFSGKSSSSSELSGSHCSDTGKQEGRQQNMFSSGQGIDHSMSFNVQQSQSNPSFDNIDRDHHQHSEYIGKRSTHHSYSNFEQQSPHGLQSHTSIHSQPMSYPDQGQLIDSMTSLERALYTGGYRQGHHSSPDIHSDIVTQQQQQSYYHAYNPHEISEQRANRVDSNQALIQNVICFDMDKVNKIACASVRKFSVTSTLSAKTVADVFGKAERDIRIVEDDALAAVHPARTLVILAKNAMTSLQYVIVEFLMISDKPYPGLLCVRIPVGGIPVQTLSNYISREISVKKVVICENGRLLSDETVITNEDKRVRRFQAVHNVILKITCFHYPTKDVESKFEMESFSGANVAGLRKEFSKKFSEAIRVDDDQIIHFSFMGQILGDDECVRIVTWPNKDVTLQVHIASREAICLNLKFKEAVGKNKIPKTKRIAVDPNLSTANLRNEVSKHMGIDPKAVKLTLNSRRIEETYRLQVIRELKNGCTLFAGIKKPKALRVKDTSTKREETFTIYMLEPVRILKQMIAEKFAIKPLHVTLEYKGSRLSDSEILLNYPIKNQTEIKMFTFPNRINVRIYMAFNKNRTVLTVDHSDRTTVDEIIRYCAITFNFDRRCARVQHDDRCLARSSTLAEEQLQSDSQVVLVHFDPPEKSEGDLITIYSVWPDGQINLGIGAVNGGHLLHASNKVKTCHVRCPSRDVDQLPRGIKVFEELVNVEPRVVSAQPKLEKFPNGDTIKKGVTGPELKALKKKFMGEAKRVKQMVGTSLVTMSHLTFPHPELALREPDNRCGPAISTISSLSLPEFDSDSETEVKKINNATTAGKSPPEVDCMTSEIEKHVSCIKGCCSNIISVLGTSNGSDRNTERIPSYQFEPLSDNQISVSVNNGESVVAQEEGRDYGKPVYGYTSGSASELGEYGGYRRVEFTLETESSDQEAGNGFAQPVARQTVSSRYDINRCPFFRGLSRGARKRTTTEGEEYNQIQNHAWMRHIMTYPFMGEHGNEWLDTAGITVRILDAVSKKIGRNWKNLARKLSIAEGEIENIEARNRDLQEKSFDMILFWKKSKGTLASKEVLLQALKDIEMVAVAEFIEKECDECVTV